MRSSRTTVRIRFRAFSVDCRGVAAFLRLRRDLASLHAWMIASAARGDKESALAKAFNDGFNQCDALTRHAEDGHLEIDNNTAERAVRGIAVGTKDYLFFGSDTGSERAAIVYSIIETYKLNNIG